MPSDQRHTPRPDGERYANDNHVLFVFGLVSGAILLRDLRLNASWILFLAVILALWFENRDARSWGRKLLFTCISVFFREVTARGTENIPRDDPCVFVCAPHANQFLDPSVMCYLLPTDVYTRGRRLGWLVAAKSWRRTFIGDLLRIMDGLPVERPQDIAFYGEGTLILDEADPHMLRGVGTKFTTENIKAGDAVVVKMTPPEGVEPDIPQEKNLKAYSFAVVHILSDTEMRIKQAVQPGCSQPTPGVKFKVQPRVTQTEVFRFCHESLGRGDCIGIFPEGGSHDRSHFLPIKSGAPLLAARRRSGVPSN